MNKKVLTLCAGVLLVSGSAVFTVNALNAGNGKAQVVAYAAQADEVTGYKLVTTTAEDAPAWWLTKSGENYYLATAKGSDWYLDFSDGLIKKIPADGKVSFVSLEEGAVSLNGQTLYLWDTYGDKITSFTSEGYVTLAAQDVVDAKLGENTIIAAFDGRNTSLVIAAKSSNIAQYAVWKLDKGQLTVKGASQNATFGYYNNALAVILDTANPNFKSVNVVYENKQLGILSVADGAAKTTPIWLTSDNTVVAADEQPKNATPAVLFDKDGNIAATIDPEAEYTLGAGSKEEVADETKYIAEAQTATADNAPGVEYGNITGVTFEADGTLTITGVEVTDVNVATYISYVDGGTTYYLTVEGDKVVWSTTKSSNAIWALQDGQLRNLAAEKAGEAAIYFNGMNQELSARGLDNVSYSQSGNIVGVTTSPIGQAITISLSQTSLYAGEIDDCEIPLLMTTNTTDYVLLGGYDANGVYKFITTDANGNAILTNDREAADLWKVTKVSTGDPDRFQYTFVSRKFETDDAKKQLKVGTCATFFGYDYGGGVQLMGTDTNGSEAPISFTSSNTLVAQIGTPATVIGFYQSPIEQYTAHWLLHRYGSSFKLNVVEAYKTTANKTINGNVFEDADLVPTVWDVNNGFHEIAAENDSWGRENEQVFLLKKKGTNLYIALNVEKDDRWSNAKNDFVDGGYKFELLSEANMETVLRNGSVNNKAYYPYFRINYLEGTTKYDANSFAHDAVKDNTPAYCVEIGDKNQDFKYDLVNLETTDSNNHLDVFITANERCADNHNDGRRPKINFFTDNENIVRGEDAQNNPLNYRYVNITFKSGANMQFQNERNNWVNLNGKVLGINQDGVVMPTEADYFLFDKAEGQWAVSMTDAANDTRKFTFTNRENPSKSIKIKSMHALGNDVYAVEYDNANQYPAPYVDYPFGFYTAGNVRNQVERDTLIIKAAEGNLKLTKGAHAYNTDSYANWTKEDLQDKTFQLSIDAASQLYVTENEGKDSHFLGLTADETEVTNWRLVPFTAARVHDTDAVKYLTAGTDSVYTISHPMYWTGSEFKTYNDTTAIVAYALQNIQNNEWLRYDPSQNQTIESMICDPNSKNFTTKDLNAAYRFVLKEKAKGAQKIEAGAYNIVGVTPWGLNNDKYVTDSNYDKDGNVVTGKAHYELDYSNKLYGASTYQNLGAIEVENMYTQPTSNDIFTIATTASQEYVLATPRDTVRIYGNEENDFLLYEKGQFLNLGNVGDIAPAVVLDSAYVKRPGNNRYQYLLVVNPDYKEAKYDNHPDNNPTSQPVHMIKPDTMYGRFLVNKIDSAVLEARYHNNPYINDIEADEKELKLGFQWGYHTGDKLFLTDGQNGPVIEEIALGTPDFNKAKFAFKYVNEAASDAFKVQTAWYDYDSAVKAGLDNKEDWTWNNEGYLKSVNGVIVVTNGYTHGEEFLMAQDETNPTANETIAAEGAISVVATDGAVIIKGAAGKNVVIATILGKVVANETINSDNETIAVPAGIAVVSVDGESFKVVVK